MHFGSSPVSICWHFQYVILRFILFLCLDLTAHSAYKPAHASRALRCSKERQYGTAVTGGSRGHRLSRAQSRKKTGHSLQEMRRILIHQLFGPEHFRDKTIGVTGSQIRVGIIRAGIVIRACGEAIQLVSAGY